MFALADGPIDPIKDAYWAARYLESGDLEDGFSFDGGGGQLAHELAFDRADGACFVETKDIASVDGEDCLWIGDFF